MRVISLGSPSRASGFLQQGEPSPPRAGSSWSGRQAEGEIVAPTPAPADLATRLASIPARAVRLAIAGYRRFVSPALPPACRFEPSCSLYADQAIERYGLVRGLGLAIVRLAKCHPFHPGGFDPLK